MMQFNDDLYCAFVNVYPKITVRSLSRLMGKYDGYWNGVNAQKLAVSNHALVQLLDALEFQYGSTDPYSPKKAKISKAKEMITAELIPRFHEMTGIDQTCSSQTAGNDLSTYYGARSFIVSNY